MAPAVFLALTLAQAPPAEAGEAAQMERIRKALTEAPAITVPPPTRAEGPVFRVTVQGKRPVQPLWDNWSAVPSNIRPWFRSYHHEFLERVTPEEFRSATLYPTGGIPIDLIIASVVKGIKASNRKRQEANAKEEVRRALQQLLACRADPDRPSC
jgi:hypothetical protein